MIINKIKAFFEKHNISFDEKSFCVCLSGGADSVALLYAMKNLCDEMKFSLSAVHVNHHIRGEDADRDEEFCRRICMEKNVKFYSFSVYALAESEKTGCGLEETARKLRYGVFSKLKKEENIDYFLTAHHANDTAETIVFNMLRGCGVSGIAGIPEVRGEYLRPFIECTRAEIMEYLDSVGADHVEDITNEDEAYTRNYIRHTLFSAFERVNPNFLQSILKLSHSARQDEDYFNKELDKITYDTDLSKLHPAVSAREICKRYEAVSKGEGLSFLHVKQIMSCLSSEEEKCVHVPFGIKGYVKNGVVRFEVPSETPNEPIKISMGENDFGAVKIFAEEKYVKILKFSESPLQIVLNRDKIKGELFARKRQDGDSIVCRGFTRSVNKELIGAKVPKHIRDTLPIVCDNEGIVFVPYVGAHDRVFQKGFIENPITLTIDLNMKGSS